MFANASHEFRTPLNAIMNSYKLITTTFDCLIDEIRSIWFENKITENIQAQCELIKKFISIGNNSSTILTSLIEDILDLSKIEAGTFSTCISAFCVSETIGQVYQIFESQCKSKQIHLLRRVEDNLDNIKILSDEGRIKQVLMNVVSNAYKFTFKGSISISVKVVESNQSKFVEFWVEDTGVGIKEEEFDKLFTLFGMLDWNKEINPHGWGIGLTVSKRFVEKLGGSIWVESKYEEGTTVYFRIPYHEYFEYKSNNQIENSIDWSYLENTNSISSQLNNNSRNKIRPSSIVWATKQIA